MPKKASDIFKRAAEIVSESSKEREEKKRLMEEDRQSMISQLGAHHERIFAPILSSMVENANVSRKEMQEYMASLKIDAPQMPEIKLPEIKVPKAEVSVKIPPIKVPTPQVTVQPTPVVMPERMSVDVENEEPLRVMLTDLKGNPMSFPSVGGGGKADFFTLKDIQKSGNSIISDAEGALKITGALSASLSLDYGSGEVGSATARFIQATDAISSVNVVGTEVTQPVSQVSGGNFSVYITGSNGNSVDVAPDDQSLWAIYAEDVAHSDTDYGQFVMGVRNDSGSTSFGGNGDYSPLAVDSSGRMGVTNLGADLVVKPIQVRGSVSTAYTSLSNGTEATLLAATAGAYHDLIYVMCANQSDAAVTVDLRMVTSGNVVMSIEVPAEGTAGIAPPVPYPQSDTGNAWTVDMPDISGTTVDITALFSNE